MKPDQPDELDGHRFSIERRHHKKIPHCSCGWNDDARHQFEASAGGGEPYRAWHRHAAQLSLLPVRKRRKGEDPWV